MPVIPRRARIWQYAHHSDHLQWQLNLYLQFRDNCKAAGNKQTQNTIYQILRVCIVLKPSLFWALCKGNRFWIQIFSFKIRFGSKCFLLLSKCLQNWFYSFFYEICFLVYKTVSNKNPRLDLILKTIFHSDGVSHEQGLDAYIYSIWCKYSSLRRRHRSWCIAVGFAWRARHQPSY